MTQSDSGDISSKSKTPYDLTEASVWVIEVGVDDVEVGSGLHVQSGRTRRLGLQQKSVCWLAIRP